MFQNTDTCSVARQQAKRMRDLISEYSLVKSKKHPHFKFVGDFFAARGVKKQNFFKYYHRMDGSDESLLPTKRGPKNPQKRFIPFIEHKIISLRQQGLSRYEIHTWFAGKIAVAPSPSKIYSVCKSNNLHRLRPMQKRCKRMIIKEKAGELGHFDCYHLPRGFISDGHKYYLVGGIDDATRLAWVELMPDVTSLSVMFGSMQIMRILQDRYGVRFDRILTDNGSEFKNDKHPERHPFEKLLQMLEIKHSYTKPYKPQSNGKIERFWRTLYDDLLEEAEYSNVQGFKDELQRYMLYYNEIREHQGIGGITPDKMNQNINENINEKNSQNCQRNY